MRIVIRDRPYDIYLIIFLSTLLFLIIWLLPGTKSLRVVLGLPFILFFPGWVTVSALFPEKRGLDFLERVAISFGLSIAIVPLLGLALNYTWYANPKLGIRLWTVLPSLYIYIITMSILAAFRRIALDPEDRFEILLNISFPEEDTTPLDKALTVILVASIILSIATLIYVIVTPKEGEHFTVFYVLGPSGMAYDYPRNLTVGENATVILGVKNHEYKTVTYTIVVYPALREGNYTREFLEVKPPIHYRWNTSLSYIYAVGRNVTLKHGEGVELPLVFSISRPGFYKLQFLLLKGGEVYRDLHLWIDVRGGEGI